MIATADRAPMQPLRSRITEVGKVRIGCQVPSTTPGKNQGKPRPERLKAFRLTSNSHAALTIAAQRYGGTIQPWTIREEWKTLPQMRTPDHQWELFTESATLDIVIRADALMSTQFEQWDGAYCTRRCTGEFITFDGYDTGLQGLECQCPANLEERKTLAAAGKACQAVSRLVFMLEGLPLGQWRLDTRGENTPAEIRGLQDVLAYFGAEQTMLRATMRLEFRTTRQMVKGKKEVRHWSCVVIEPRATPEELLSIGAHAAQKQLTAPGERTKTLETHIADLYGDDLRGSTDTHLVQGETGTIEAQITTLLLTQGLDDAAVAAWWVGQRAKHADLSPGYLTYLYGQLQQRAEAKQAEGDDHGGSDDAPQVPHDGTDDDVTF